MPAHFLTHTSMSSEKLHRQTVCVQKRSGGILTKIENCLYGSRQGLKDCIKNKKRRLITASTNSIEREI